MVSVPVDRPVVRDGEEPGNPERPVLLDLMAVGVYVNSVWDLVSTPAPLRRARPVLRRHLEHGDHPPEVVEGLRRALTRND